MVYYFDQNKTYVEARRHCKSYDSHLLEIWNVEEWNEVKIDYTGARLGGRFGQFCMGLTPGCQFGQIGPGKPPGGQI